MQLYNTLSQQKEPFLERNGREFRIFACGPTVQDNIHLGHAKTYLAFDVLVRWLLKRGNKVVFVINITDVDDKIFDRAKEVGVPYTDIANKFYDEFLEDMDALNIVTVSKFCRVSRYVEPSAGLVAKLLEQGIAYNLNGNVYFDVSKANHFGKLSHQSEYDLKLKQIDAAPGKRNSVDFLLWRKIQGESEGIWEYPSIGAGRPGWHIQDSAIAFDQFSGPYDLHGGATELIFPHHEAELAQDEALSHEIPYVSIWMHTGLLLKDGEKMSKSLGNVVSVRDALKRFSSDELRFFFLSHHYRDSFDVNLEDISDSAKNFKSLMKAAKTSPKPNRNNRSSDDSKSASLLEFEKRLDDDLDTPAALKILQSCAEEIDSGQKLAGPDFWYMIEVFGFKMFQ